MKKNILSLLILLLLQNLFAQNQSVDTLITINKNKFRIQTTENSNKDLILNISLNSKVKLKEKISKNGLLGIEFIDFDKDNNKDIRLTYLDNNLSNSLYLFDPEINNFSKLVGFEKFPEAIQLKSNPNYYYSYHRAGCADLNWVSDLFTIEDFKSKHIGHIYANGCESETNSETLNTYKVLNNNEKNKKLIDKLNYSKSLPTLDMKWKFIENYWNKNYKKFDKP